MYINGVDYWGGTFLVAYPPFSSIFPMTKWWFLVRIVSTWRIILGLGSVVSKHGVLPLPNGHEHIWRSIETTVPSNFIAASIHWLDLDRLDFIKFLWFSTFLWFINQGVSLYCSDLPPLHMHVHVVSSQTRKKNRAFASSCLAHFLNILAVLCDNCEISFDYSCYGFNPFYLILILSCMIPHVQL